MDLEKYIIIRNKIGYFHELSPTSWYGGRGKKLQRNLFPEFHLSFKIIYFLFVRFISDEKKRVFHTF